MKEVISSRQNPRIREVCGLVEKKKRRQTGLFRLDGIKLLREALATDVELVEIYLCESAAEEAERLAKDALRAGRISSDSVITVSESVFGKMTEEKSPEGVIAVAKQPRRFHRTCEAGEVPSLLEEGARLLLAEALRDPGNLGTVMRSCAALGIDCLILSDDCADLYNPKTVRSAMGALFRLPTVTVPAEQYAKMIGALRGSGRRVFAAALHRDAHQIGRFSLRKGDCFVIGNEGHGLTELTVAACDGCAVIPMREGNESLNAAAAAAICIWETVRVGEAEA